jgi:hypothetical protein
MFLHARLPIVNQKQFAAVKGWSNAPTIRQGGALCRRLLVHGIAEMRQPGKICTRLDVDVT